MHCAAALLIVRGLLPDLRLAQHYICSVASLRSRNGIAWYTSHMPQIILTDELEPKYFSRTEYPAGSAEDSGSSNRTLCNQRSFSSDNNSRCYGTVFI